MVGRELPNLRPSGEDHQGAGGGKRERRNRGPGRMEGELSRNWRQNWKIRIRKALGCFREGSGLPATRSALRVRI